MNRLSVAVCDENPAYVESVGTWLFVEQGKDFSGSAFSSVESFHEQYDSRKFQIILLGKAFIQELWIQKAVKEERQILWIYLQEDEADRLSSIEGGLLPVAKYQPLSVLVRSIYQYYEEYQQTDIRVLKEKAEVLGWYSPEHTIWQTPLAMTMAALLAEKQKVLYVNLMECTGLAAWFGQEYEGDLLEVMYYCQRAEKNAVAELGKFVYSIENLDYIPPARDGQLLCELTGEDYTGLISQLQENSVYDVLVLDMGNMFPGFFDVWKCCSHIYLPCEQNVLAKGVRAEFEETLRRQEGAAYDISWLELPEWSRETIGTGCLMQQWLWGGPGDYVRGILDGRIRRT